MTRDWLADHRAWTRWAAALLPVAVGALLALLREGMNQSTAAMVLVLTVVAAAASGDRVAGIVAALSAAGSFDFFLTEPYYSFSIHQRDDLTLAIVLVVVGLAVTEIALWGRRQQAAALRRDGYIQGLTHLLDLPSDTSEKARADAISTAITRTLGADRSEWVPAHPSGLDAVVEPEGQVRARGRLLAVARAGLPTESCTAVPVTRSGVPLGHFRVVSSTHVARPTVEQLRVAVLLADRMSAVESLTTLPAPPEGTLR
jgi:K+-sensing histidine kinase KdpD